MALMSYLIRNGLGTYDFRRELPVELRPFMPEPWPAAAKKAGSRLLRDGMADFEQAAAACRRVAAQLA